ncbi:MAG TPA: DUF2934 domain-containing protein [Candidatus Aquilonibacter sp.]|nr:DUF2934 domain-containing protein [Candidatus Aquilonibacter sp.]
MSDIPNNEQIQARAYELYLERGGEDGHDVDDWLAAEKELTQQREEMDAMFDREEPEAAKVGYAAAASGRRQ